MSEGPANAAIGSLPISKLIDRWVEWTVAVPHNVSEGFGWYAAAGEKWEVIGLYTAEEVLKANTRRAESRRAAREANVGWLVEKEVQLCRGQVVSVFPDRLHAVDTDGRLWEMAVDRVRVLP